jgi:hypothetical protein
VALSQARILYQNHSGDYPQVILTIPVTCRTTVPYLRVNGPGSGTEARGKEEDVQAEGDYNQRTIICKQNKNEIYLLPQDWIYASYY